MESSLLTSGTTVNHITGDDAKAAETHREARHSFSGDGVKYCRNVHYLLD